jgi:hypothetical protein
METHPSESNTAEYEVLASILRDTERRLSFAQLKTAKREGRLGIRHAIQQVMASLKAADYQAKRLK